MCDIEAVAKRIAADPEYIENMRQADEDLAAGRTHPLSQVLDELRDEAGKHSDSN
jgi:hypothetical protein